MIYNFLKILIPSIFCISVTSHFPNGSIHSVSNNDTILFPGENHFTNIRQLTFGGDNAEAYFSFDGQYLIFQKTNPKKNIICDQIWMGKIPTDSNIPFEPKPVSNGLGRTTCSFFYPDGKHILYASTFLKDKNCPVVPDRKKYANKYIWPLYDSYDIFKADTNGKIIRQLTKTKGYDAEATISPKQNQIVFTSMRSGDPELYSMDLNGKHIKQLTNTLGYDGGAWFSADGTKLIWRASRPQTPEEIKEYKELMSENLVAPVKMELWIANADGTNAHQLTSLSQANWAPNFTPDGNIIFCSNHEYKRGFPFNMYLLNSDGTNLSKISRDKGFDAFPMFSPDGKRIVFCSNRNNGGTHDTNIFIADWVK